MNAKKILSLTLSLLVVFSSFYGCKDKDTTTEKNDKINETAIEQNAPDSSDEAEQNDATQSESELLDDVSAEAGEVKTDAEEVNEEENTEEVVSPTEFKSLLTGLASSEELVNQRPVAIMFNNIKAALPQHGIGQMEVVYEAIVEGSITRLLGVTTDWASLPTLGSIRSSRDYYIDFADAHNAIYVHAGGSELAYSTLSARGTDNIDGTNGPYASTNAFYRNQERRKKGVSLEHTLFTSGSALATAISNNKYTTTLKDGFVSPFRFADSSIDFEGSPANYIYVPFSTYAQSYFDYNSESGMYVKGQYLSTNSSLDKHNSPHIDGNTNESLEFKNIITLFTKYSTIDNAGRQAIQFTGSGTGYYFTDGKCKSITWKRASRTGGYTLYEADGTTELIMNPGKIYIGVLKTGSQIVYK